MSARDRARGDVRDRERQLHHERRAHSVPRALGGDHPAVQLDEVLDERQTEPEAAVGPGARRQGAGVSAAGAGGSGARGSRGENSNCAPRSPWCPYAVGPEHRRVRRRDPRRARPAARR